MGGTQHWTCAGCNADCSRPTVRGQRPKWCDSCRARGRRGRACATCGTIGVRGDAVYCGAGCVPKMHGPPAPPRQPVFSDGPACAVFIRDCIVCARSFATPSTAVTCSPACAVAKHRWDKREERHRHRARKRGAFVAPVNRRAIYERDQWTCMICGDPVNRAATVPELDAPTLDHVVPLALGGTHEPSNVQCAHYYCNSVKGATHLCLTARGA